MSRSSEPPRQITTIADAAIHVVDNFFTIQGSDLVEWAVVVSNDGGLHALRVEDRSSLPSHLQSQLAFNEVARASTARILDIAEFYLFDLKVAEQPSDEPGPNDPVYLYGTLFGPYGQNVQDPPVAIDGQLTLTRADVLEGVICGVNHAFRYANPAGAAAPACRAFQLMLPIDREDRIQRGCGIALAFPLLPAELLTSNPANEVVVNQIVFDMLTAMKQDVTKANETNPLRNQLLPVPSRALVERELVKQGYRIEGNTAVKTPQATGMVGEFLLAIFGDYVNKRVAIPPEGSIGQFVEIAQKALSALQGWPPSRTTALVSRLKTSSPPAAPISRTTVLKPSPQETPPAPRLPSKPPLPPRPNIYKPKGQVQDWMQDFVDAHRTPGRAAPKLTRVEEVQRSRGDQERRKQKPGGPKKEWMKDFE